MASSCTARTSRAFGFCVVTSLLAACGGGGSAPLGSQEHASAANASAAADAATTAACPAVTLASGLLFPQGVAQSNTGNLLVSEAGTGENHAGRVSIVDLSGQRRTLVDGLPSGRADVGDPAGPAGLFLRGRTLYVAIGIGDALLGGPAPGTASANPNPSSPILSSVLAMHFSAAAEQTTTGFHLAVPDQQALASGEAVTLSDGQGNQLRIELVANFKDYIPAPRPDFADNARGSNPFDLTVVGDRLYVTDGGMNMVRQVDLATGAASVLATFPPIPNPMFPEVGPPVSEAVPTGIRPFDGQLLVTLFRGAPFAPGTSVVEAVDPATGNHAPVITQLKTAIDVLPFQERNASPWLVLQHDTVAGPFFGGPGVLLRYETPAASPTVVADCLEQPTSMVRDARTGTIYATELTGRVVAISAP